MAHAAHALTWIRGPKAVASSSSPERVRLSLEVTGLIRFFEDRLYSAASMRLGKPAPDLFVQTAARSGVDPAQCIVVEDSAPGIAAAVAAGMTPIGFVGGSEMPGRLAAELSARRRPHRRCRHAGAERRDHRSAGLVNLFRHCEERSDEAIQGRITRLDCFASLAMTGFIIPSARWDWASSSAWPWPAERLWARSAPRIGRSRYRRHNCRAAKPASAAGRSSLPRYD